MASETAANQQLQQQRVRRHLAAERYRDALSCRCSSHLAQQTEHCRMQLQLALKDDPNFAPARELLADLDNPPTTPNNPGAGQVLPAGYVQPAGQ